MNLKDVRIKVPIPLPKYTYLDDWMGKLRSQPSGKYLDYESELLLRENEQLTFFHVSDTKEALRKFIYTETIKFQNHRMDGLIEDARKKKKQTGMPLVSPKALTFSLPSYQFSVLPIAAKTRDNIPSKARDPIRRQVHLRR